jgi:hypothetical protein
MLLPYRETIAFDLFTRNQRDGSPELVAFFTTPIGGWKPMIAVWVDKNEASTSPEDTISFGGVNYAYCISDETASDFDNLEAITDRAGWADALFVVGALMRRVI